MPDYLAKFDRTIEGHKFEVLLLATGKFRTDADWMPLYDVFDSLEALEAKATKILKANKVEINIPIVIVDPTRSTKGKYVRAYLRGRHSRSRDYLLTIHGEKITEGHVYIIAKGDEVTNDQIMEANRLAGLVTEAEENLRLYLDTIKPANARPSAMELLKQASIPEV